MPTRTHHKTLPKLSYDSPRFKLTPERAVPLIKWFDEHKDHPYPTRHEKILLCQGTQLTFTQVYAYTGASINNDRNLLLDSFCMCCIFMHLVTLLSLFCYKHHSNWLYISILSNYIRACTIMHIYIQVSTWFANARRRMKKASTEEEEAKSSSNCSSPESPSTSASPEEKSTVVVESTFSSATITVTDDKDTQGELTLIKYII